MRIGQALRELKDKQVRPRSFLKELATATGIEYSRMRKLAADQANATVGELLAIQGHLGLEPDWYKSEPQTPQIDRIPSTTLSTIIDAIANADTPQVVRSNLAGELKRLLAVK